MSEEKLNLVGLGKIAKAILAKGKGWMDIFKQIIR